MVLEYCSRQSLAHVLEARQTLTEPEVRYYLRGLVSGLRYLHRRRIVHRDLKLSNFFLNKNMEVKIGDLGLATRVGPGGRCHRVLCGTPNFLAPEVVSRNGHSCQSDIWALGCLMFTELTGVPPFVAAPLSEMYQNIREGRYPEPAHLSPSARRLIARLLAPDPAERPSLDHLLQDDFFTQGFTLDRLPPHCCHSPPVFTIPPPLGRLFRKVGRLLLAQCWPPCPFTPMEASGPGEDGSDPDSMEWGSEASLSESRVLCPERPIHLLTQGTLRSDPAGPEQSPRQEVEAAIRNLRLCLDSGPPGRAAQETLRSWEQQRPAFLGPASRLPDFPRFPTAAPAPLLGWDPGSHMALSGFYFLTRNPGNEIKQSLRVFRTLHVGRVRSRPEAAWPRRPAVLPPRGKSRFPPPWASLPSPVPRLSLHRPSSRAPAHSASSSCPAVQDPPGERRPVRWAPEWVDYSSKYGFGYQLSDGGSGVLLRDGTHMALRPPGGQVCYAPHRGNLETFTLRDVPGLLGTKLAVLRLFARYMQQRRREEGGPPLPAPPAGPGLCLLRFVASEGALLLLFSDGSVQVSCCGNQSQLVLSGGGEALLLTVWEQGQPGTSYPLAILRSHGCAPAARQHLQHAVHMLQSI
nr:inactive serine/threonine-protein kinase PLK5 isoform X1 [Camelus dromedarius]